MNKTGMDIYHQYISDGKDKYDYRRHVLNVSPYKLSGQYPKVVLRKQAIYLHSSP